MAKQRVGYFEDLKDPEAQCSRCRMCELICAFHHHQIGNPRRGKIKVIALGKGSDIPIKKPGQFAAFPDSEINISPIEGTKDLNNEKAYNYAE